MKTNEKILVGGAAAIAAFYLYKKFQTPATTTTTIVAPGFVPNTGIPANTGYQVQPSGTVLLSQPLTASIFEGKVNTAIGRNKYVHVAAHKRHYPNIGAYRAYGNCQCANGKQCVGSGDCSCCDQKIHTVILPFVKKTGTANGAVAVRSANVGKCNYAYAM